VPKRKVYILRNSQLYRNIMKGGMDGEDKSPNSGWGTIFLICKLKEGIIDARLRKDYNQWYDLMVEYFFELCGSIDTEKKFNKEYTHNLVLMEECKKALNEIKSANGKPLKQSLFEIFDLWLLDLKRWHQKSGLGIKPDADPRYAMGEE